jgi:hypothetical protein
LCNINELLQTINDVLDVEWKSLDLGFWVCFILLRYCKWHNTRHCVVTKYCTPNDEKDVLHAKSESEMLPTIEWICCYFSSNSWLVFPKHSQLNVERADWLVATSNGATLGSSLYLSTSLTI